MIKGCLVQQHMQIVVAGGGVGGPAVAFWLAQQGHQVTVIEQRGRPTGREDGNDSRGRGGHFTLNAVAKDSLPDSVLAELQPLGLTVTGRQVDIGGGRWFEHAYGRRPTDSYLCVGRELVRAATTTKATNAGAKFLFGARVTGVDAGGKVDYRRGDGRTETIHADLVIAADGRNSLGRALVASQPGVTSHCTVEQTYVTGNISQVNAERAGLKRDRLVFFPGVGGVSIALPKVEGGASVLVIGDLGGEFTTPPFIDANAAREFLAARHPRLLEIEETLPDQLVGRDRGAFYYSDISRWSAGRVVLVGDSGRASPAYLGAGAAMALNDARSLAEAISAFDEIDQALDHYESSRVATSELMQSLVKSHSHMILTRMGGWPWRIAQRASDMTERVFGRRNLLQRFGFDSGGLQALVTQKNERE